MAIKLTNQMKVDTLHKLLEEYGKQIQWVKDLDFKVIYYTLGLLVGIVAWFISNPPHEEIVPYIYGAIIFLDILSIIMVIRNHCRHVSLLDKLQNVHSALFLDVANYYTLNSIEKKLSKKIYPFMLEG